MNFILNFCMGILIGAGAILPGISSGVLCVIFGIYENLLNCCCDIGNNINDSGIILPSQPKCKVEGETILIIPISVCI